MKLAVVVVAWLCGSCISPIIPIGDGKTPKQAQRETMNDFTPARLAVEGEWSGEITTKTVRVWADHQFRAQNMKWQQTFEATLEMANLVLERQYGLRLVADYRTWDRHVPGSTLPDDLAALAARDPGADALVIIGLTTALPLVSATLDELGIAALGGRHLVVRGYADLEERKIYADAFRDLLPEERELALEQRRQHKTAVVLLHELGHTFGAEHDTEEDRIMSTGYSHRAATFSAPTRALILRTIDARIGRGSTTPEPTAPERPASPALRSEPIVLHVNAHGVVTFDDRVVDDIALDNLLDDAFQRDRDTEIVIKRARKAPASALQRIVTRTTAIGLTRVSMTMY